MWTQHCTFWFHKRQETFFPDARLSASEVELSHYISYTYYNTQQFYKKPLFGPEIDICNVRCYKIILPLETLKAGMDI
jgi:hypothetical protein